MNDELISRIKGGRTDLVIELLKAVDWQILLAAPERSPLVWFVFYNDVTALKLIKDHGFSFDGIALNDHLHNAAFFGHWKVCEFLIGEGADPNHRLQETSEPPLHDALCKAGRPVCLG